VFLGTRQGPSPCREGGDEGLSPLRREGSLREKASPLAGRKWCTREGSGHVPKDKTSRCVASGSCQDLRVTPREHTWRTRGGSPLWQTSSGHHYHTRHGNDGHDQLVKSHRCSAPDRARDSSRPSATGLCHRLESRDICCICNPATVVSP
jgi:hypothetical protein